MQCVCVTAESPSLRNLPYFRGLLASLPSLCLTGRHCLYYSGQETCAFCPGGRYYFCFSRLCALQRPWEDCLGWKLSRGMHKCCENCPPTPEPPWCIDQLKLLEWAFNLTPCLAFDVWGNISLHTPSHARWVSKGENIETCLSFSVLHYSHTCVAGAGKHLKMHFSGNGSSHQTIEFCWFHLPNIGFTCSSSPPLLPPLVKALYVLLPSCSSHF